MKSHEIKMATTRFGDASDDIKPVIPRGRVGHRGARRGVRGVCRAGRDAPTAKLDAGPRGLAGERHMPPDAPGDVCLLSTR